MNKVSKKDYQEINRVHDSLELQRDKFNRLSLELHEKIQNVINSFVEEHENEIAVIGCEYELAQEQLGKLVVKQTEKMDGYLLERSDSWHDNDSGVVFNEWLDCWNDYATQIETNLETWIFEGSDLTRSEPNELPLAIKPKL